MMMPHMRSAFGEVVRRTDRCCTVIACYICLCYFAAGDSTAVGAVGMWYVCGFGLDEVGGEGESWDVCVIA